MSAPGLPSSRRFVTQLLNSLPSSSHHDNVADESTPNPLRDLSEAARKQLISLQVLFPNEFVPALDLLDRHLVTRFRVRNEVNPPVSATVETQTGNEAARLRDEGTKETDNTTENSSIPQSGHQEAETTHQDTTDPAQDHPMPDIPLTIEEPSLYTVYYVRSAQHRTSRYTTSYDTTTTYEVRLHAWNCSCPAFAFAAFPAVHMEPPALPYNPLVDATLPGDDLSSRVERDGVDEAGERDAETDDWVFGGVSLEDGMPPVCKHLLACVLVEKCEALFGGFVEEKRVSVEEAAGWAAGWGD